MDGLAGELVSLKGNYNNLSSILHRYRISDKEIADAALVAAVHPEWDGLALGKAVAEKTGDVSWDAVWARLESTGFKDVNGVLNLLRFLSSFNIVGAFLSHIWQQQHVSGDLAYCVCAIAASGKYKFDLTPIVTPSDVQKDQEVWNLLASSQFNYKEVCMLVARNIERVLEIVQQSDHAAVFLILGLPTLIRNGEMPAALIALFESYIGQNSAVTLFIFRQLARIDRQSMTAMARGCYERNPRILNSILEIAHHTGTLNDLLSSNTVFSLELAAWADKRDTLSFEKFLNTSLKQGPFLYVLLDFLETRVTQDTEHGISLRSVAASLKVLSVVDLPPDQVERAKALEVQCLQTYPRLINMGQGFDSVILANDTSNQFPEDVENDMKVFYQKMYAQQIEISEIISMLGRLKESADGRDQDLFACMVHSLFDEYRFFPEYPLNALATTAVLFGSLVSYKLVQGMPLTIALQYIMNGLKSGVDTNMFKFGLQALFQFKDHLSEYPQFCKVLREIPGLRQQTQMYGLIEEGASSDTAKTAGFQAVSAGVTMEQSYQEDPAESLADKVLFIVNNLSVKNLEEKTRELKGCLTEQYYQWFAMYLVGERAKQEPNYHSLYISMLTLFNSKQLENFVVKVTLTHVKKLLDSEDTASSSDKRKHLKNLGQWLGAVLLARNRPILHKNIYFKRLLLEGYNEEKLGVVLPFVCKTLEKAASSLFKPPNPWLMGIMYVLAELYEHIDLKLNLKFEIEVLCSTLGLELNQLERANYIRNQPEQNDIAAGMEQLQINNPPPEEDTIRLNGSTLFATYPPLKKLFTLAIDKTIQDLLQPVLDRSAGIASVATRELISKDFAMEPDEAKMRVAAHNMVQVLASNLTVFSSKDMLVETLAGQLRAFVLTNGFGEQQVMEHIPVAIDDNIELVTQILEQASVTKAQAEVDQALNAQYRIRQQFREVRPNQVFNDPHAPARYPIQLPTEFTLKPGGLTPQQLAIYEKFGRAEEPAMESSPQALEAAVQQMRKGLDALEQIASETGDVSLQQLQPDHKLIGMINQLLTLADRSSMRDQLILKTSQTTVSSLFTATRSQLGREALALFLDRLCKMSATTAKEVIYWLIYSDDERKYDVNVVTTLIRSKLVSASEMDMSLAKQIATNKAATNFAVGLIRATVLDENACVFRTEFTCCLEAMEPLREEEQCKELMAELESASDAVTDPRSQMSLIFTEWLRLVQHPAKTDRSLHLFVYRLSAKGILSNDDHLSRLVRYALDAAVLSALSVQGGNQSEAFIAIDALAKLIVTILQTTNAPLKQKKDYAQRILSVISLVFAKEHDTKLEQFNGRPYFRLFSTILYELTTFEHNFDDYYQSIYLMIANCLQSIQPMAFPAFSFAWMTLISHRLFLPKLMKIDGGKGKRAYVHLLEALLKFMGEYAVGKVFPEMIMVLYKGVARTFLVLLSDYSNFLIEYHYALCNAIPQSFIQIRNVVTSAYPVGTEIPDPLTQGLKVDRLPEVRQAPPLADDPAQDLQLFGIKKLVDTYLKSPSAAIVRAILPSLDLDVPQKYAGVGFDSITVNIRAINAIVLYTATTQQDTDEPLFNRESAQVSLLTQLLNELSVEGKYFVCESMADQLRYPNRHTHFFSCAMLSIFGNSSFGDQQQEVQQLVTRALLQRIISNRPHPWGLVITFTELLKNKSYKFWDLPVTRSSPQIEAMFKSLYDHLSNDANRKSVN